MAQIITAPSLDIAEYPSIFLAGGISNCPVWQDEAVGLLKDEPEVTIFNPRRENFNVSDPNVEREQITWEYNRIAEAGLVIFWFPKETLCPITLFELGKCLAWSSYHSVMIGMHPEYKRKNDVLIQSELMGYTEFYFDLSALIKDSQAWIRWENSKNQRFKR